MKMSKGPSRLSHRFVALCDLSDVAHDLSVAPQIVNKLGVCGAEEPFTDGAKPGLCGWSRFLGAFISGQECFEICALELAAAINDDGLRQTAMASNTVAQNHHARSVARFVEC